MHRAFEPGNSFRVPYAMSRSRQVLQGFLQEFLKAPWL